MFITITEKGEIISAPKRLKDEKGNIHYHPNDEMYRQAGYLKVVDSPLPELLDANAAYYDFFYESDGCGNAVQTWFPYYDEA